MYQEITACCTAMIIFNLHNFLPLFAIQEALDFLRCDQQSLFDLLRLMADQLLFQPNKKFLKSGYSLQQDPSEYWRSAFLSTFLKMC